MEPPLTAMLMAVAGGPPVHNHVVGEPHAHAAHAPLQLPPLPAPPPLPPLPMPQLPMPQLPSLPAPARAGSDAGSSNEGMAPLAAAVSAALSEASPARPSSLLIPPSSAAGSVNEPMPTAAAAASSTPAPALRHGKQKPRLQLSFKEMETSTGHVMLVSWRYDRPLLALAGPRAAAAAVRSRAPSTLDVDPEAAAAAAGEGAEQPTEAAADDEMIRCFILLHNCSGNSRVPWVPATAEDHDTKRKEVGLATTYKRRVHGLQAGRLVKFRLQGVYTTGRVEDLTHGEFVIKASLPPPTVSVVGSTATISWERHFRHSAETEYALEWQEAEEGGKWREVLAGRGTRYTMYGLAPGKRFQVRLRAGLGPRMSPEYSPAETFWTGSGPPNAPSTCNCTPVQCMTHVLGDGSFGEFTPPDTYVHVDWEPPRSTGGAPITRYVVLRSRDPQNVTDIVKVGEISLETAPDNPHAYVGYSIVLYMYSTSPPALVAPKGPAPHTPTHLPKAQTPSSTGHGVANFPPLDRAAAGGNLPPIRTTIMLPPLPGADAAPPPPSAAPSLPPISIPPPTPLAVATPQAPLKPPVPPEQPTLLYVYEITPEGRYKISAKKDSSGRNYVLPFPIDINAKEARPELPTEMDDLTVTAILPGHSYRYQVIAVNEFGVSPPSDFGAHTGDLELYFPETEKSAHYFITDCDHADDVARDMVSKHANAEAAALGSSFQLRRSIIVILEDFPMASAKEEAGGKGDDAGGGVSMDAKSERAVNNPTSRSLRNVILPPPPPPAPSRKQQDGRLEEQKRKLRQLISRGLMRVASEKAAAIVYHGTSTFVGSVLGKAVRSQTYESQESKQSRRAFLVGCNNWNEINSNTWVDVQSILTPGITFPKERCEEDGPPGPDEPEALEPNTTTAVWIKHFTLEDERGKQAKMLMLEGMVTQIQSDLQAAGVDLIAEDIKSSAPTRKRKLRPPEPSLWRRLYHRVVPWILHSARIGAEGGILGPAGDSLDPQAAANADEDDESDVDNKGDAGAVSASLPMAVVLIGGHAHHLEELVLAVRRKIPILIVEGTKGLADDLAKKFARWQAEPDSLDDEPVVAEIVEDGEIAFIDLNKDKVEDMVVNLKRFLSPTQTTDDTRVVLTDCWTRFAVWTKSADRQRFMGRLLNFFIQLLGLLSILTVVVDSYFQGENCMDTPEGDILGFCINGTDGRKHKIDKLLSTLSVLWPIVLTATLSISSRLSTSSKFAGLAASAEMIKAELMKFRTRAGFEYRDKNGPSKLAEKVKLVSSRLMTGELTASSLDATAKKVVKIDRRNKKPLIVHPFLDDKGLARLQSLAVDEGEPDWSRERAGMQDVLAIEWLHPEDNGFAPLEPDQYIRYRIAPKMRRYRSESKELALWYKVLQIMSYLIGGLGAILGAINYRIWIAVTTGAVSVLTGFQELEKIEMRLMRNNLAMTELNNLQVWWAALSRGEKLKRANVDKLVLQSETVILGEIGWMTAVATESGGDEREEEGQDKKKGAKQKKGGNGKGKKGGDSSGEEDE